VDLPGAVAATAGRPAGLLVVSVSEGGPADGAGITVGDVLLDLGEAPLTEVSDLMAALGRLGPGVEVSVRFARGGEVAHAGVELGQRSTRRGWCG
jgi:S1-C subfamily serine protease